ncbi:MAG TPA: hypothetical protein VGP47_05880, partial [Parachlamydiaceae bacterium]|nr:hypothetical protein [Parachlamydiaceae bacterium]
AEDELISKLDIYGKPVFTLWKWIAESMWYTHFADQHPECSLINATEGGIGFPEVVNMPLAEVKQKYLDKQLDLKSLLHGEIQNSPLPSTVNDKNITGLIQTLMDSLARCGESCKKLVKMLVEEIAKPQQDKAFTTEIADENRKLLDELAYDIILKRFDEDYSSRNTLEFKRLENDKSQFPEEEYFRKKTIQDVERYHSLMETCLLNANLVFGMLDNHKKVNERLKSESQEKDSSAQKLREEYLVPFPKADEIYIFDGKTFRINDPELQIDYSEDLTMDAPGKAKLERESLFYPSDKIKMEKSYRGNVLHGPSTFYAEKNGTVLSRAWYVDGRQEGKMWTHYPDGALHSLQRFEKGAPIGIHQYFYANGLPKSILPYRKGVLHGEVHLFSPEGILIRRLNFVEGKRTGQEQIWNEDGVLIIECQFEADLPIGLARMWHRNGVLAKEFIYDKDSRRVEAKEWDGDGILIEDDKRKNDDYFDQVNRETEKLTASLSDMVSKVSEIAPLISERFHFDIPPKIDDTGGGSEPDDLSAELANLQKEMEHLLSLDSKLKEQLGGVDSLKEAIWKTPAARREMEKQFEGIREKINANLGDIQNGISTVVNNLKDKPPEK